jgi:hypothetical protein
MSDLYDKIRGDVPFRRVWTEKSGFGFELPQLYRMYRKKRINRKPLKPRNRLNGREKDWSALADDFRTFLLLRDSSGSIFQQFTA